MEQDELDAEEEFVRLRFDENWIKLEETEAEPLPQKAIYRFSLDWPLEGEKEPLVRKLSSTAVRLRILGFTALVDDSCEKLEKFISYGVDISKPVMSVDGMYYGSFLHFALLKTPPSPIKIIKVLLSSIAELTKLIQTGKRLYSWQSIRHFSYFIVRKLLESGASLSKRSRISNYATALSYAAYYEKIKVIKLLLEDGWVDVNEVDSQGRHVLDVVLFRRNVEAFRLILNCPDLILSVSRIFSIFTKIIHKDYESFLHLFCTFLKDSLNDDLGALRKIFLG